MADLDHLETPLAPPVPRSTDHWTLPKVVRIEGDPLSPNATKLIDDATGEQVQLPIQDLTFNVSVDQPNNMVLVLGGVGIRATVHYVSYEISEDDLRELARQNGFEIAAVPVYGARVTSYGPAEHMFTVRDLPGWQFVHEGAKPSHASLAAAGASLRQYVDETIHHEGETSADPSELQDGEFELMAHRARA